MFTFVFFTTIHPLVISNMDDWTYAYNMGNRFNYILNRHNIIHRDLNIEFVLDMDLNKKYNININEKGM